MATTSGVAWTKCLGVGVGGIVPNFVVQTSRSYEILHIWGRRSTLHTGNAETEIASIASKLAFLTAGAWRARVFHNILREADCAAAAHHAASRHHAAYPGRHRPQLDWTRSREYEYRIWKFGHRFQVTCASWGRCSQTNIEQAFQPRLTRYVWWNYWWVIGKFSFAGGAMAQVGPWEAPPVATTWTDSTYTLAKLAVPRRADEKDKIMDRTVYLVSSLNKNWPISTSFLHPAFTALPCDVTVLIV
jgi:hypothetical protein